MKKERGITLIALIITIIIMLILVGVVMHELGSDNGIIVKARWAEFVTEYERVDEAKELYAAGKMIDRYDDEARFTLESLFSNVSHAEEKNDMLYPVDLNQEFYISEALETLKDTICEVEKLEDYELWDLEKVNLFRVDFGLLNDIEVKREYIINTVSGMLYYIDGEPYRDRIYHTLRYGSPKELNEPEKPEPDEDDENPDKPTVDPDLKIHYLSGFDGKEYTQKVKQSQSSAVVLNPVEYRRNEYTFLYWKDVTDEKGTGEEDETSEIDFEYKTGGYYDVANKLIDILGEMWETDILEIIEDNADYEPDPDDDESAPDVVTQTKNEILDYLSVYQAEIQAILKSDMSMDGLVAWFMNNTSYLTQLEEYESEYWTGEEEEPDDEEQEMDYDIYGDQEVVNMGEQDMWLEAVWVEGFITLDANGGKIRGKDTAKIGVEEGKTYGTGLNMVPVRANYVFAGWFTEKDGGIQKVKSDVYSAADLPGRILYAHWEDINSPNIVSITYNANGGTMRDAKKKKVQILTENRLKGTKIAIFPAVQPETAKKDWFFKGWFTSAEGGTKVNENTIINESITVYAQWTDEPNVRIVLNGGELFTRYTKAEQIQEKYDKWNPVKYYDGVDSSKIYAEDGKKIPRQAKGRQMPNTIAYYRSIRKVRSITKTDGKEYKAKSTFKGWYTGPNGTGTLVESNGRRNKYYDLYGDTLYAHWREKYIIKYDANGGYFGSNMGNTWKQKGVFQDKKYPSCTKPKKAGYTFSGWYDSQEGGNKIELANAGYIVKENTILYAHWEPVKFQVTVSNVKGKTWSQKAVATSGSLTGYKKTYYISKTKPSSVTSSYNYSQTGGSVLGKEEATTYYVWAKATKDGVDTYSSNYVRVITSHKHSGNPTRKGGCYDIESACSQRRGYIKYVSGYVSNGLKPEISSTQACAFCGVKYYKGAKMRNTAVPWSRVMCLDCGATFATGYRSCNDGTYFVWICDTCENGMTTEYKEQGYINYPAVHSSSYILYHKAGGTCSGKLKHTVTYSLICGKPVQSASSNSYSF